MFTVSNPKFPLRRGTDKNPQVAAQLTLLAYKNLPTMLFVNISATLGGALVLANDGVGHVRLWIYLVAAMTILRLSHFFLFKRFFDEHTATHKHIAHWLWIYAAGLITAALIWNIVIYFAFAYGGAKSQFTLIIIVSALAAGATGITAAFKYTGRIYITLLLLINAIIIYFTLSEYWIFSALGFVFWCAMIISHRNNHHILHKSLTLQLENNQLIDNLQNLNTELEQRVHQRTEALRRVAHHDALTGLPNRLGLAEWMEHSLDANNPQEAAVLFLDLDRFKQINDALGHEVGDQVLRMIAFRFKEVCPSNAILARWGGDEFLLITQQIDNAREIAENLARELINAATSPLKIHDEALGLGLSVGMAYYPTDATNFKDAIHAADLTVAEVKRSGRGHSLIYNDIYADTQKRRFELGRALSEAIKDNQLTLAYQPVINAQTGALETLEVLARWHHPVLGTIDPSEFIYLAEETDRIIALGDWVLNHACQQALSWLQQSPHLKIAINVSIKQLLAPNFAARVNDILKNNRFPARALILEVTESLFGEAHLDITLQAVKHLRQLGIDVYIDDFGTGYSSLSRLHEFPVTGIKIDRSFTEQLDKQGLVIIESALLIAHCMNLKVIVEGVETFEQAKKLSLLGVTSLQGYYFSKPTITPTLRGFPPTWQDIQLQAQ